MKVRDLTYDHHDYGIKVTRVAPSEAERLGYVSDTERLLGQTGTVLQVFNAGTSLAQAWIDWDSGETLFLASDDEIALVNDEGAA